MTKVYLKEWRNYRGLSVRGLERESRVSLASIVRIESGKRKNPGVETLEKLGNALRTQPFKLLKPPPKRAKKKR